MATPVPAIPLNLLFERFSTDAVFRAAVPHGNGHINDTYAVTAGVAGGQRRFILQRLNTAIFTAPELVMANIDRVLGHLRARLAGCADLDRCVPTLIPARDGRPFLLDEAGGVWRLYRFIEGACSYEVVQHPRQAYQAGRMFGLFQRLLADFPVAALRETLPDFHDTPKRHAALEQAVRRNAAGRASSATREIDFFGERRHQYARLLDRYAAGELPLRVTHNDTKLNNVLFDESSGEGLCVVDLDTVMPGLALYDFGDLVRTATCPAAEDAQSLEEVTMRLPVFEELLRGYLSQTGAFLTEAEVEELAFSGRLLALEMGMRFLADHLNGDIYYKTNRPNQNLDRCRVQCRLVESMEAQSFAMERAVAVAKIQGPAEVRKSRANDTT